MDSKGRVMLPLAARQQLGMRPGDFLLFAIDATGAARLVKVVNPFDVLAAKAVTLDDADLTIDDSQFIANLCLAPDAEPFEIIDEA
jgi:bifunctional DNA-binding transcriptional regulator/antitoxin component of YhaV-PrlF toxin-antitoxin module